MNWFENYLTENIGEELKQYGFKKIAERTKQLFSVIYYKNDHVYLYFEFEDYPNLLSIKLGNLYKDKKYNNPRLIGLYHLYLKRLKGNIKEGEGLEQSIQYFKKSFPHVMKNLQGMIQDVEIKAKEMYISTSYDEYELVKGETVISKDNEIFFEPEPVN